MAEPTQYECLWSKVERHLPGDFPRLPPGERMACLKTTARKHADEDFHMIEDSWASRVAWENALEYCVQCLGT